MNLSFQEKSYWASLIIMLNVWINYFVRIQPSLSAGTVSREESLWLFIGAIVVLIILEIVVHTVLAASNSKSANAPSDERDKLINSKAGNVAGWVLAFCVVMIGSLAMFKEVSSVLIANLLLLSLVMSQCVEYALALFLYRRGW